MMNLTGTLSLNGIKTRKGQGCLAHDRRSAMNILRRGLLAVWTGTVVLAIGLAIGLPVGVTAARAQTATLEDGASVLMYHRFGENDYPSTSITLAQIDAQIKELTRGDYAIMALPEIVRRLKAGQKFPRQTVGVSIDDAYLSVYTQAWPRFKKAGIPFTVFVATDPVDRGYSRYMTWAQIREMAADPLVTIGSQTAAHAHMIGLDAGENAADLAKSSLRFKKELGYVPKLFAYPYGEFDRKVIATVKKAGFVAGFGQQSGAFGLRDDIFALPRFSMNENYGDLARLRTAARALPIPTTDFTPTDTLVLPAQNPPAVGFTLSAELSQTKTISCFSNQEGRLKVERLGPRVEVRMRKPLPQGRTRLNCTLPAGEGRWRWLGRMFYVQ